MQKKKEFGGGGDHG